MFECESLVSSASGVFCGGKSAIDKGLGYDGRNTVERKVLYHKDYENFTRIGMKRNYYNYCIDSH